MCVQCGSYLIHCLGGFRIIKSICFCHLSVSANLDVMFLGCLSTVFVLPRYLMNGLSSLDETYREY